MSEKAKRSLPYKNLGTRLKHWRERSQESLAEVSGAVEIDTDVLDGIEQGKSRPSEDILELLISHFNIREEEAKSLWQLAGYEADDPTADIASVVVLPMDTRIAYTDMLNIIVNDYGVTLQFMQSNGPNNQPQVISRLGMSKDHARSIIELMQNTLARSEPRALPPSASESN